jgi:uncharacterized protein YoxC
MNAWLLATVIILIVAVVVLIGCIAAVIMPLKNIITILLTHAEGIQKQLNGIQVQTTALNKTVDRMKNDIDYKKTSIQGVIQSFKETTDVLNEISESTERATMAIVKHVNNDAQKQAQVEQWTNKAMSFLNRIAQ